MTKPEKYPPYRQLVKEDGTKALSWNGKLHSWDSPALITPEGKKEYYLYGIQYTHEEWKERRSDRSGIPFYKDPTFRGQVRF
jgi:hypothetical protein